jgi:hypothetical protein
MTIEMVAVTMVKKTISTRVAINAENSSTTVMAEEVAATTAKVATKEATWAKTQNNEVLVEKLRIIALYSYCFL